MAKYEIKLLRRAEVAAGTMSFFFEKPAGFTFKPGQNADFTLIDPAEPDPEGHTRTFTIASAPFEPELMVAMRMQDTAFKRALGRMAPGVAGAPGGSILMEGPMGSMTLQNDAGRPAVFIAGGIGITPFVSMIREATHRGLPHELFLFYSNRTPADAAFLRELTDLQNENHRFHLVPTMTQANEDAWDGETGRIDGAMISKYLARFARQPGDAIFYIAGSFAMATAARGVLDGLGVDSDFVKAEEFAGY